MTILSASGIEEHPALAEWWASAEDLWDANKVANDESALLDRIDFHGQLSAQLPTSAHRAADISATKSFKQARTLIRSARDIGQIVAGHGVGSTAPSSSRCAEEVRLSARWRCLTVQL